MARTRLPQNAFSRGELDPRLLARSDTKLYGQGCKKARNVSLKPTGGFRRRPGSRFIADLTAFGINVRLAEFVTDESFRYLFVFRDTAIDIYDQVGVLLVTYVGAAWTAAMLPDLYWTNSGDTMVVTHRDMPPQKIVKLTANSFNIAPATFEVGGSGESFAPQWKHASSTITIALSATTGSVTVTASAAYFTAAHVGLTLFKDGKALLITAFTDSTHVTATVQNTATVAASAAWTETAFSSIYGYPVTCAFYEQRLAFCGHKAVPDAVWFSKPNAYFNHALGTQLDNDAIAIALGSDQRNEIRAVVATRHFQIFTNSGVFFGPTTDTKGLTPTNCGFRRQVPFGTIRNVKPRIFDGATLFVQKDSDVVREFLYKYTEDAYSGDPVSTFSQHLINNPIDMTVVFGGDDAPDYFAVVLNGDGTIAQYQSLRSQEVSGWALWETDGDYLQVAAIESVLFTLVRRTVNNVTRFYLEKFDWGKTWTLDCGIPGSVGVATQAWTGAGHLIGKTVHAVKGGLYLGTSQVDSFGGFTVNTAVDTLMVGLDFFSGSPLYPGAYVESMPPDAEIPGGSVAGEIRHIVKVVAILDQTLALAVNGQRMLVRRVTDDLSLDPTPVTGRREFYIRGWSNEPTVVFSQLEPLQMEVLGAIIELEV